MPNMAKKKVPAHEQEPDIRNKNFDEVTFCYSAEQAKEEAQRCLNCKNRPCVEGCPVNVQIPDFIALIEKGDTESAFKKINETNSLPAVCGRVCPQESQCEAKCVRGLKGEPVAIGRLERFAADQNRLIKKTETERPASNGHKIAVIGSGPAGLTCAGDLPNSVMKLRFLRHFTLRAVCLCTAYLGIQTAQSSSSGRNRKHKTDRR